MFRQSYAQKPIQYVNFKLFFMNLGEMIETYGIYMMIIQGINSTSIVRSAKEIKNVHYDPQSGGIFYKMVRDSQVIPTSDRLLYVGPSSILQIAFNERERTPEEKALDDLPY